MNNEETLNPNFNINAKYEYMIERAKHNIDLYLETGKDCSDISLSYDVKNYLPNALKEIERLNNIIKEKSLLLIEFQDMEQKLKEKDNIINELKQKNNLAENILYDYLYNDGKITKEKYEQFKGLKEGK